MWNKIISHRLLFYFLLINKILADCDNKCILKMNKTIFGVKKFQGIIYCEYLGIPYAMPPVNNLRYELPRKYDNWMDKENFITESSMCMQRQYNNEEQNVIANFVQGDEDCLYLNVRTPLHERNEITKGLLPVMIWLHGGSFNFGSASSDINGFDYFIEKDVIVVSLNYRLGSLGFLSVPNSNISANLGLRDQQMAMEWVQENIVYFGGNPGNVTLFGWSAGSASVTYHLYSEISKNLFHKAIVMSGTMLNPWAFNPDYEKCGEKYCDFYDINYYGDDVKQLLQNINSEQLYPKNVLEFESKYFGYSDTCFVPSLETKDFGYGKIITEHPEKLVSKKPINDVPLLIGHTDVEHFFPNTDILNFANSTIEDLFRYFISEIDRNNVDTNFTMLMRLQGVYDMLGDIRTFAKKYAENTLSKTYFYRFSFVGKFGFSSIYGRNSLNSTTGAMHGDDIGYLFNTLYEEENSIESCIREQNMRRKMINLWTNFIKTGEPITDGDVWPPYNTMNNHQILDINDDLRVINEDNNVAFRLWNLFSDCIKKNLCEKFNDLSFVQSTLMNMTKKKMLKEKKKI